MEVQQTGTPQAEDQELEQLMEVQSAEGGGAAGGSQQFLGQSFPWQERVWGSEVLWLRLREQTDTGRRR